MFVFLLSRLIAFTDVFIVLFVLLQCVLYMAWVSGVYFIVVFLCPLVPLRTTVPDEIPTMVVVVIYFLSVKNNPRISNPSGRAYKRRKTTYVPRRVEKPQHSRFVLDDMHDLALANHWRGSIQRLYRKGESLRLDSVRGRFYSYQK